jgi:hypothetical protein
MIKKKPNPGGLPYADRNEARRLLLERPRRTAETRKAMPRGVKELRARSFMVIPQVE